MLLIFAKNGVNYLTGSWLENGKKIAQERNSATRDYHLTTDNLCWCCMTLLSQCRFWVHLTVWSIMKFTQWWQEFNRWNWIIVRAAPTLLWIRILTEKANLDSDGKWANCFDAVNIMRADNCLSHLAIFLPASRCLSSWPVEAVRKESTYEVWEEKLDNIKSENRASDTSQLFTYPASPYLDNASV